MAVKTEVSASLDDLVITTGTEGAQSIAERLSAAPQIDAQFAMIGGGSPVPTVGSTRTDGFVHGSSSYIDGVQSFAQGLSNTVETGHDYSFAQGKGNTVKKGTVTTLHSSFAQGLNNVIGNLASTTVTGRSFAQGEANLVGYSGYTFAQGKGNDIRGRAAFGQGLSNTVIGLRSFAQGEGNSVEYDNSFTQGQSNVLNSATCFAQGFGHYIGYSADGSFTQGDDNNVPTGAYRSFSQGKKVEAKRADQKSWGSNRVSAFGQAQFSHITKYISTPDATPVTLFAFTLEINKSYIIEVHITAKNETTENEAAAFFSEVFLATKDTLGGSDIVPASPTITSRIHGAGTPSAAVDLSGDDVRIRVTGEAVTTWQWCATMFVTEVFAT